MDADVVVIGAGAAGLAAARSLATRTFKVLVLEARDRIGGRVWSRTRGSTSVELGAEFIHGKAEQTMAMLREAGEATVATVDRSLVCGPDGHLRVEREDFVILAARAFERVRVLGEDESAEELLRDLEGDAATRTMAQAARAFVEGFEAAEPGKASAKAIAAELRSGVDSESSRPLRGYAPLFAHLHNECIAAGVTICLCTVARRIEWGRGPTLIHATGAQMPTTLKTRAVVLTVPVGVLRCPAQENELAFNPELPGNKREALEKLEMGQVVKVALRFKTAFWENMEDGRFRQTGFFRCEGQQFAAYWTQAPLQRNYVVAWAGGPKATALSARSNPELIALALNGFGELLGDVSLARKEFEGAEMHDWTRDPFSRGAYSYVLVGGENARGELAAAVDDTLFFAGEATSTNGEAGTVNGALETGLRAAREASAALGGVTQ